MRRDPTHGLCDLTKIVQLRRHKRPMRPNLASLFSGIFGWSKKSPFLTLNQCNSRKKNSLQCATACMWLNVMQSSVIKLVNLRCRCSGGWLCIYTERYSCKRPTSRKLISYYIFCDEHKYSFITGRIRRGKGDRQLQENTIFPGNYHYKLYIGYLGELHR